MIFSILLNLPIPNTYSYQAIQVSSLDDYVTRDGEFVRYSRAEQRTPQENKLLNKIYGWLRKDDPESRYLIKCSARPDMDRHVRRRRVSAEVQKRSLDYFQKLIRPKKRNRLDWLLLLSDIV